MTAMTAMTTVFLGGKAFRLDDNDLLGQGGEGRVYRDRSGDRAIKIFLAPSEERRRKLRAFPSQLPPRVVGPIDLAYDKNGDIVGYAMRRLDGAIDSFRMAQRKWREATMRAGEVTRIWAEVAQTVGQLHARGIVVGDLNDGNVVLTRTSPGFTPWLIDADSMQLPGHPCVVAHERFLDPRLYGVDLTKNAALSKETDWYALAVLLFSSLACVHPYGGSHPSFPTMLRRAEARHSVLRADVKLPASSFRPDVLSDDVLAFFHDVFERDLRAPLPARVLDVRFASCACGIEHARTHCPACATRVLVRPQVRARGMLRATTLVSRTKIRAASAWSGRLEHLTEDELAKLDVKPPVYAARPCGSSIWIGTKDRFTRFEHGVVKESIPVSMIGGELAADAGPAGLVYTNGDQLLRACDGTRIGQILEGQTHVRVGASVGFAFYRAGGITVSFVFDPRKGPLRQVALPAIEGRLVDWSAVFDDAHALVSFVTESSGKVIHAAHLVDANGVVVASERGTPDDSGASAILASVSGKCLANGAVLCATDDGLVLVRADRSARAFVPARVFADAKDFVSPDLDLFLGPGGSVYVVAPDEIVHLSLTQT